MPAAKKLTWEITENDGTKSKIEAERYVFDSNSGRHLFYNGDDELVGNLINVSVLQQS